MMSSEIRLHFISRFAVAQSCSTKVYIAILVDVQKGTNPPLGTIILLTCLYWSKFGSAIKNQDNDWYILTTRERTGMVSRCHYCLKLMFSFFGASLFQTFYAQVVIFRAYVAVFVSDAC